MQFVIEDWPFGQPFPKGNARTSSRGWWDKNLGFHVYSGATLPKELRPYRSKDFSLARWCEDEINGTVMPTTPSSTRYEPRPHQVEGAQQIIRAYGDGERGFLEADGTGLGKTLTILSAVAQIAEENTYGARPEEKARVLIVCPKSVIPHWRQTIRSYPPALAYTRPLIINYQRLNKILKEPDAQTYRATGGTKRSRTKASKPARRSTKRTNRTLARCGEPKTDWDIIIFDEAHALKNYPDSNTSLAAVSVARLNQTYAPKQDGYHARTPFVIFSTATPGASPLNLAAMAGIIAPRINKASTRVTPSRWGQFLHGQGFHVTKTKKGQWQWVTAPWWGKDSTDPTEKSRYQRGVKDARQKQRRDSLRVGKALTSPGAPFLRRNPKDIAGWPEQQIIPFPISMDPTQQKVYETLWSRFRQFLNLTPAHKDPKAALTERLRYRQKTSLLKVDNMVPFIADQVNAGNQVLIACEFTETIDRYHAALQSLKITNTEISGRVLGEEREHNRLDFQTGRAQVVMCTIPEGISLHAGETLPDGTKATTNPRITILHEVRENNVQNNQILGRAHRDGQNSLTYVPYLEDTVDTQVIASYVNKTANMNTMTGEEDADQYERIFRQAAATSKRP